MISGLEKQKNIAAGIFAAVLVIFIFTACTAKAEFALEGNDKTISIYSLNVSFSMKLSEEESEKFISLINDSEHQKAEYDDVDSSDYNEMNCVFLNKDSIVYNVMQSKSDKNMFCIKTHKYELADQDISPEAYTFESEALADFISGLKETAVLPDGYVGEIANVGEDNTDIELQSPDGQKIDLQGEWIFKTIASTGSDDPNSKSLDYGAHSSCWGNAITLNRDGTGIMTYSYDSGNPLYEAITWSYLLEGGKKTGLLYGNSSFEFILKFTGVKEDNPIFEMIDATGGDAGYGADFKRTAELARLGKASDIENETGIKIYDIYKIKVGYNSEIAYIDSDKEVRLIVNALKQIDISPAEISYEIDEKAYKFSLIGQDGDAVAEISMDISGQWLVLFGECYKIEEPSVFHEAKTNIEKYIDFSEGPEKTDIGGIIGELSEKEITRARASWSHFPQESYRVEHWQDDDFLDNWGYQEQTLSEEDASYVFGILNNADFETLDREEAANTDFLILLDFKDDSSLRLAGGDEEVYLGVRYQGEWINVKVLDVDLFEYVLSFGEEDGFDMERVDGTESVIICYVKDADRKDYPENGKITEIEITDSDMVKRITDALTGHALPTMTYPSRESSDIIFHVPDGDYYGKIKFPVTTDENGINEPTIIMNGYYWYSCEELYKILIEIENAQ